MTQDSTTPQDDGITELERRLAEIEAGVIHEISYTSRTLIQMTLPHSARAGEKIVLVNGDTQLTLFSRHGLPYGSHPRLLLCWLTREALRRRTIEDIDEARSIPLSGSLAGFMRAVGIKRATGGERGTITSVRKQLKSLFSMTIGIDVDDSAYDRAPIHLDNSVVAEELRTWWDPMHPDDIEFSGYVTLSRGFFKELITNPVPLRTSILQALRRSPMALDIYMWLTYRISYLRQPTMVSWAQLRDQFGAGYPRTRRGASSFKQKFGAALGRVLEEWPEATIEVLEHGVLLRPGQPSVSRREDDAMRQDLYGDGEAPF